MSQSEQLRQADIKLQEVALNEIYSRFPTPLPRRNHHGTGKRAMERACGALRMTRYFCDDAIHALESGELEAQVYLTNSGLRG